jgi:diguanylate cyclase (GGDEF)-like protein
MVKDNLEQAIALALHSQNPQAVRSVIQGLRRLEQEVADLRTVDHTNNVSGGHNAKKLGVDVSDYLDENNRREENDKRPYIAMVDIDNFGYFNKRHGHEVGDLVLKNVHDIMIDTLREDDLIIQISDERYGYHLHGEEMATLYTCRNNEDAKKVAEKIRKAVEIETKKRTGHKVTISVGVTDWKIGSEEFRNAQNRADKYMQIAKIQGRNQTYSGDDDPLFGAKSKAYDIVREGCKVFENLTTKRAQQAAGLIGGLATKAARAYLGRRN